MSLFTKIALISGAVALALVAAFFIAFIVGAVIDAKEPTTKPLTLGLSSFGPPASIHATISDSDKRIRFFARDGTTIAVISRPYVQFAGVTIIRADDAEWEAIARELSAYVVTPERADVAKPDLPEKP